jgi:hypothetical protein
LFIVGWYVGEFDASSKQKASELSKREERYSIFPDGMKSWKIFFFLHLKNFDAMKLFFLTSKKNYFHPFFA